MTVFLFMLSSIGCMVAGHMAKVKRWGLLVEVYERPPFGSLLTALALGHSLNTILPMRLGDVARIAFSGKKLKNGYSFAIATVLADLYVDLVTVGAMLCGLAMIGKGGEHLQQIAHQYILIVLILIPMTVLCILCRAHIKRWIARIAMVFNETIEFRLLYVSYLSIASVKDIILKISKLKYITYTVCMWSSYVVSYMLFAEALQAKEIYYSTSEVFAMLFSGLVIYHVESEAVVLWGVFLLCPLLGCFLLSRMYSTESSVKGTDRLVLPQVSQSDRLAFLRTYYAEENRDHIKAYLEINRDAVVMEDSSAGSNASTVLVLKNEKLYYRKYAFDNDGRKLAEQIDWIEAHQKDIPLPSIVSKRCESNFATYDMPSYASSVGLFRYFHTTPVEEGWKVLRKALEDIRTGLHTKNERSCDLELIREYIASKVKKNLEIITGQNKYISSLEKFDEIEVNGRILRPIRCYRTMLDEEHMKEVFSVDKYSDIHGDLTVENIICLTYPGELAQEEYREKVLPQEYYFIDPNTGNVHDSPFLDYAKLLQSLHGNYEFLMMVKSVSVEKNRVSFMQTKSEVYAEIYQKYKTYLQEQFSCEEVLSIYYHEIVHWLRLMPYKIRKNEKLAVVFYTGLLSVLNDVWELEHEEE